MPILHRKGDNMGKVIQANVHVVISVERLTELAQCCERMTEYTHPNEKLLIAILKSEEGVPVQLFMDKRSCKLNNRKIIANSS